MKIEEPNIKFFREKKQLLFLLLFFIIYFLIWIWNSSFGFLNSFNLFGAKLSYFISGQFTIYLSIYY